MGIEGNNMRSSEANRAGNGKRYPYLEELSREVGVPAENLVRTLEIEEEFHERVLRENDPTKRKHMYREVYSKVHALYPERSTNAGQNSMDAIVRVFRRQLENRSILDVGCGSGEFLMAMARLLPHKRLVGIDTSATVLRRDQMGIQFIQGDIIDFTLGEPFDVVFSHNVLEHIAPADVPAHLTSLRNAVADGGMLILVMAHRLFGPSDVTRIVDYTRTNRIPARGTHLFESTYSEVIPMLREHGFSKFYTLSRLLPLRVLKHLLPSFAVNPSLLMCVERSRWLLRLVYRLRWKGKPVFWFKIHLICE